MSPRLTISTSGRGLWDNAAITSISVGGSIGMAGCPIASRIQTPSILTSGDGIPRLHILTGYLIPINHFPD
jgi:hypothetical protein